MAATTLHVRVEENLKNNATAALANDGLTLSEAIRMFLAQAEKQGGLPIGLTLDPGKLYDAYVKIKVQEALDETGPGLAHEDVMKEARALVGKFNAA